MRKRVEQLRTLEEELWLGERGRFGAELVEVVSRTCWKEVPTLSLNKGQWAAEQGAAVDASGCDAPSQW